MLLGKTFGNGLHIASLLLKGGLDKKDISALAGGAGDSVLGCAAACAMYDELLGNGLLGHIKEAGSYFKNGLLNLKAKSETIVQVRGEGLALAIDFMNPELADNLYDYMRGSNLIPARNKTSIVFKPPYSINTGQIDETLEVIERFLDSC